MFGARKTKEPSAPAVASPTRNGAAAKEQPPVAAQGTRGDEKTNTQEAQRRAAIAIRHSLAFAQIVSLLMRSPRHKHYSIADLEWLVLPPLLIGNFSVAEAKSKQNGVSVPVALALWASVSAEVDKRLSEGLDKPMRLRPDEWRSGDILWLVDALGDPRVVPQLLKQLGDKAFKGREVKVRRRGEDGKLAIGTLQSVLQSKAPG